MSMGIAYSHPKPNYSEQELQISHSLTIRWLNYDCQDGK
jgi:hypothetical protein